MRVSATIARQAGEVVEQWSLGVVMGGQLNDTDWSGHRELDYFDMKGVIESLCEALRVPPPVFEIGEIAGYTSGTVAQLKIAGDSVGVLGQVAQELLAPRKIQGTLFAAELDLGKWTELAAGAARFFFARCNFFIAEAVTATRGRCRRGWLSPRIQPAESRRQAGESRTRERRTMCNCREFPAGGRSWIGAMLLRN